MTGFWYGQGAEADSKALPANLSRGPRTGFVENFAASWESMRASFLPTSRANTFSDAYAPIVDALNDDLPAGARRFLDPIAPPPDVKPSEEQWWLSNSESARVDRIWQEVARRRAADPTALPTIPKSREDFERGVIANVNQVVSEAADVNARAGKAGTAGMLAGGLAAGMTDPINLATIPVGAPGSFGILRTMAVEAALNVAVEGAEFPLIKEWRDQLGLGYSTDELLQNMAFAAGGGALLGGTIKGAPVVFRTVRDALDGKPSELIARARKMGRPLTARERGALRGAERQVEIEGEQPVERPSPVQRGDHRRRVEGAQASTQDGTTPNMPDRPPNEGRPAPESVEIGNLDNVHYRFSPDELVVDAKRFQFKAGGDTAGVTERLRGVEEWDPIKAGLIVVYEDAAGARFIADGHQRLALAKRLQEQGQKVSLYGHILRESDGITPDDARAIAAIKNIAEGTGSPVDAAKVLRVDPGRLAGLPVTSGLVRVARDLINLDDHAFMMVVNEVVPAHYAALVGRLAGDRPDLHVSIMGILARTDPDNLTQAESIVRQALDAGATREKTSSLFGDEDVTVSLFAERAKVLDRAMKQLRRDRAVFNTLVGDSAKITQAGNRLAGDVNAQRARTDAQAIQTIQTLANRRGPLADALNEAAERFRSGDESAAVADFVERVRQLVAEGSVNGSGAGAVGRGGEAAAQARAGAADGPPAAEREALTLFSDPGAGRSVDQSESLAVAVGRDVVREDELRARANIAEGGSVEDELRNILDRLAPHTKLIVTEDLFPSKGFGRRGVQDGEDLARGQFRGTGDVGDLIRVALAENPFKTVRHEAVHALRKAGMFTDAEWRVLEDMAPEWRRRWDIDQTYRKIDPDIGEDMLNEEGIARAFEEWAASGSAPRGARSLFERVRRFFRRLRNMLRARGFQTFDDVFRKIEAGQVGARERAPRGGGDQAAAAESPRDRLEAEFANRDDEFWGIEDDRSNEMSIFSRSGHSATTCTGYACAILDKLGPGRVRIHGFMVEDNPAAELVATVADGHDFAVVDGRYIVDPWVSDIENLTGRTVFDLQDAADAPEIRRLYGDPSRWSEGILNDAGELVDFRRSDAAEKLQHATDAATRGPIGDMAVPVGLIDDGEGGLRVQTLTVREVLDEIEGDFDFLDAIDTICGSKGGA